jgi:hypothetical protein
MSVSTSDFPETFNIQLSEFVGQASNTSYEGLCVASNEFQRIIYRKNMLDNRWIDINWLGVGLFLSHIAISPITYTQAALIAVRTTITAIKLFVAHRQPLFVANSGAYEQNVKI